MNFTRMLKRELEKGNDGIKIVEVPEEKRPKAKDLAKLDKEIKAQIDAISAMEYRSYINASKDFLS